MASPIPVVLKQRYRILGLLGKGGFGTVYKAEDMTLGNRLVAVKEMDESELKSQQEIDEAIEAFEREALLLAGLHHPNLPHIYEHFEENNHWYLVMDFIEGETLDNYLGKALGKKLPVKEALDIGITLCNVLHYLHTQPKPIIFRDLKPANIMRTPSGHLYLIDFGIARHFKPGKAKDTISFVSEGYAPPEQYGKTQTTPRSDIYALGATLHQMLSSNNPSSTAFHFKPPRSYNSSVPSALDALIMQMLKLYEDERPASAADVKKQLQDILNQLATLPLPVVQPVSPPSPTPAVQQPPAAKPLPVSPVPAPPQVQAPLPSPPLHVPHAPARRGNRLIALGAVVGGIIFLIVTLSIIGAIIGNLTNSPLPDVATAESLVISYYNNNGPFAGQRVITKIESLNYVRNSGNYATVCVVYDFSPTPSSSDRYADTGTGALLTADLEYNGTSWQVVELNVHEAIPC